MTTIKTASTDLRFVQWVQQLADASLRPGPSRPAVGYHGGNQLLETFSMDWSILWWLLAILLVIAGLAGTVVPALPGVPLVFFGLLMGAWIDGFEIVGWGTLGVLAALAVVAWVIDFLASAAGARYVGAGPRAFWGATLGAVVGMFFGLPGMVIGPFIGAVVGELSGGNDLVRSGRAGVGAWLGIVVATAVKLAIAFLMIGLFVLRIGMAHFAGTD